MTANYPGPPGASDRPALPVLLIGCDSTRQILLLPAARSRSRLVALLGGPAELIPLTPRACLCVTDNAVDQHQPVNSLASALLGFLQLPIVQVLGTACITGYSGGRPTGLTEVQQRGFSRTLTTLLAMPDYLALHAQACRISASWGPPPRSHVMTHPKDDWSDADQLYEATPDWVDAAPFRTHARALITETGLPWRIIAAHAEVSPRALQTLLHGRRNGQPVHRLHLSVARALTATSVESIRQAATQQTDAGPVRALLQALTRLGVAQSDVGNYLSAGDWHQISQTTLLYCSVAARVQVTACYDLITTAEQRTGTRGGRATSGRLDVDCSRHGSWLDRKQEAWPLSFSSPTPPRTG